MQSEANDWSGFWIGQNPLLNVYVVHSRPSQQHDDDWHEFVVEAVAGGFKSCLRFESLLQPFQTFRHDVLAMHTELKGSARFRSTEGEVQIGGTIDRFGHVFWNVTLRGTGERKPQLTFSIEQDQTLLWNVAAKIEEMLDALGFGLGVEVPQGPVCL